MSVLPTLPQLLDAMEDEVQAGGCLIDWHACDLFPRNWIDLVVVLRVQSNTLYDRLTARYLPVTLASSPTDRAMQAVSRGKVAGKFGHRDHGCPAPGGPRRLR